MEPDMNLEYTKLWTLALVIAFTSVAGAWLYIKAVAVVTSLL